MNNGQSLDPDVQAIESLAIAVRQLMLTSADLAAFLDIARSQGTEPPAVVVRLAKAIRTTCKQTGEEISTRDLYFSLLATASELQVLRERQATQQQQDQQPREAKR